VIFIFEGYLNMTFLQRESDRGMGVAMCFERSEAWFKVGHFVYVMALVLASVNFRA